MPNKTPTLLVQITHTQGVVLIKLIGEARLDLEDAAFQLNRVVALHPHSIVVDLAELSFLSSIGMSLLVNLRRTALKSNGTIKLAAIQPRIAQAMGHARLLELFEIHPDLPSALAPAPAESSTPT